MHVEKYNRNAVGHMIEHYERNPRIYKTQEHIHPELKELNYTIGNDKQIGMSKYKKIITTPELKIMNRADVNTLVDVVLTLPKAKYFPQERHREFFEVGYSFLLNKFCNGNEDYLVGCYCHADESKGSKTDNLEESDTIARGQIHMHFAFAPIVEQNGKLKVCAAKVVTRSVLRSLHQEASEYFKNYFGFDVGILNGVTKEGNLTVPQLKEQTKKCNELIKNNAELQKENQELKDELEQNMQNLKIWQESEGIIPTFELQK